MNRNKGLKINSRNIITSFIVPAVLIVFAAVLGLFCGFNQGIDLKGGVLVSIVAEKAELDKGAQYAEFKGKVDQILSDNKVSGSSYQIQKDPSSYHDVLVVKIDYQGEDVESVVDSIKSDLISEFYADVDASEIELRNLVNVSTFESSLNVWTIIYVAFASLVALILVCVYIGFRKGLFTSVVTLLGGIISNALALSLLVITRVQTGLETVAIVPFVTVLAAVLTYIFVSKAKDTLKSTDKFDRKSNYELANAVVSELACKQGRVLGGFVLAILLVAFMNVLNPIIFFGFAIIEGILASLYTVTFIVPAIFGLAYVRKIKKERAKKEEKETKLDESDVLKETDLDKLTSN